MLREQLGLKTAGKGVPNYVEVDGGADGDILIGHPDIAVYVMSKTVYLDIFEKVYNPKDFVLKLVVRSEQGTGSLKNGAKKKSYFSGHSGPSRLTVAGCNGTGQLHQNTEGCIERQVSKISYEARPLSITICIYIFIFLLIKKTQL